MKMKKLAVALSALALAACMVTPALAREETATNENTAPYITKVINTYQGVNLKDQKIDFTITMIKAAPTMWQMEQPSQSQPLVP